MGPFESKNVISEIQIQKGQWIPAVAHSSDEQIKTISIPLAAIIILISISIMVVIWSACVRKNTTQ
jgi:hypothetical protein